MNMTQLAKTLSYGHNLAGANKLHALRRTIRARLEAATENHAESNQELEQRLSARTALEVAYYNGRVSALKDILTDMDCMGA